MGNVLFIWGLNFAAYHLLAPITSSYTMFLTKYNGRYDWTLKPLFTCRPCMSTLWGVGFWITPYQWYLYPIWVICLAGASHILNNK